MGRTHVILIPPPSYPTTSGVALIQMSYYVNSGSQETLIIHTNF